MSETFDPFDGIDAQKAFEKFLPLATAMAPALVKPYRITPDLAIYNIGKAMPALLAKKDEIAEHFKKVSAQELLELPALALGTKYAALVAEKASVDEVPMPALITEGWHLRGILLTAAKSLARSGLIPEPEVAAIVAGRGVRDMADDCVDLASLYRKHAAKIAGKHAVTSEEVERAAVVGSHLSAKLKPGHAAPQNVVPTPEVDVRNRMATLLVDRHDLLQRVMHYFNGAVYEELAPPLMSRAATVKKPEAEPSPPT